MTSIKDVRKLIKQTRHKDASLRALAAVELGEVGSKYPIRAQKNIKPALDKAAKDSDKDVQTSAQDALNDVRAAYVKEAENIRKTKGGKFKNR